MLSQGWQAKALCLVALDCFSRRDDACVKLNQAAKVFLYLAPTNPAGGSVLMQGDGLYLGTPNGYHSVGKGLIFRKNSPFKSIPLLDMLL